MIIEAMKIIVATTRMGLNASFSCFRNCAKRKLMECAGEVRQRTPMRNPVPISAVTVPRAYRTATSSVSAWFKCDATRELTSKHGDISQEKHCASQNAQHKSSYQTERTKKEILAPQLTV